MNGDSSVPEGSSTYEGIMGIAATGEETLGGGAGALSNRLVTFREWVTEEAQIAVHPSICIVNGEATDGTRNAPVLVFGPPPGSQPSALTSGQGRIGMVDGVADRALYERTIGCQVRTAREIKKDEVMMTVPRPSMVTPDVVAASDAGRAVLACCKAPAVEGEIGFWDTLENTTVCEQRQSQKAKSSNGTQLLVKILQERKRAESSYSKAAQGQSAKFGLAAPGIISTRAPILAFLIQQRFSPNTRPALSMECNPDFDTEANAESNALSKATRIQVVEGTPETFAPYARTLPSSVSLPICWKRNELALLSGCITGIAPLQEIAATTLQLVAEFVALIDAGILTRFPSTFPPGLLTWERWMWAASVFASRVLPATCYLNEGEPNAVSHVAGTNRDLQSPKEVWDELGVMVPLLDMLNHEIDTHQVTWQPNRPEDSMVVLDPENEANNEAHAPRAVMHKKVRKGQQVYTCYGANLSNRVLMLQYGFCQLANTSDETRLGWGLMDAVGFVPPPSNYAPLFQLSGETQKFQVFESTEPNAVNEWWSDERLELLELEVAQNADNSFMSSLRLGKKMTGAAHGDGTYDPILLTTTLIGTMPVPELSHHMAKRREAEDGNVAITISQRHQLVLRSYLAFIFSQKLEKLLENLDNGLKGHFGGNRLWTKVSKGGIRYKKPEEDTEESHMVGWQSFFDEHAYGATMEVEKRYYALGPDSCVLTLYDGQLQALQATIDGLITMEKFETGIIGQLRDLNFKIGNGDETIPEEIEINQEPPNGIKVESVGLDDKRSGKKGDDKKKEDGKSPSKKNRRNRKRNNSTATAGSDRPPAVKLHIGNLAYSTLADDLYGFFAHDFGRDNVLECHIPTERETGKSRGFGFVTLPEHIARQILSAQRKFELNGRILKIAASNSAGSNKPNQFTAPTPSSNDRCGTCGYRPKYCVCAVPNLPGQPMGNGPRAGPDQGRDVDYYGSSRQRRDRNSRSRSPHLRDRGRRSSRDDDNRDYPRDSRERRHYQDRSRSRSNSRDRGRDRRRDRKDRSRDRSRDRSKDRSRERSRGRDKSRERSRDRSRERSRDRSRDRSRERSRDQRDRHGRRRSWEHRPRGSRHSRSRSPSYGRKDRSSGGGGGDKAGSNGDALDERKETSPEAGKLSNGADGSRTQESRKRRSRSRSRGRNRKNRKKKRHARSRSRSASPGSPGE